jgi:hypothetical protein
MFEAGSERFQEYGEVTSLMQGRRANSAAWFHSLPFLKPL